MNDIKLNRVSRAFVVVCLGLCVVGLGAANLEVSARVIVPARASDIGEVRLGDEKCEIISISSAEDTPILVVLEENGQDPSHDVPPSYWNFDELQAALPNLERRKAEVWASAPWGARTMAASFPQFIGYLLPQASKPTGEPAMRDMMLNSHDANEFLFAAARRFAGNGPVRLFWMANHFAFLDPSEDLEDQRSILTSAERYWPWIGDAGITLYPISGDDRKSLRQACKNCASSLFGARSRVASSRAPGETLMRAIAESDRSSVATIRVKANQLTWRGLPPTLNVYDRTGKRIYHRPFVAGGNVSPHGPADFSEMARIVCRLVRHLDVGEAHVSVYCGVRAEGGVYLEINDVKFPARQSEQSPVWVTTRRFGADSRPELTVRGQEVRLLRTSRGGCVGPLNIEGDSDIYLYSPVEQWITALRVRLAGQ